MRTRTPAPLGILAVALLVLAAGRSGATPAPRGTPDYDPARVGWSEVRLGGSKLFISADATLSLRPVAGPHVVPDLLVVPSADFTPLPPAADLVELVYQARGAGRASRLTLLMDPRTGAALQRVQHDQQGKLRLRTYRFGREGAWQRTLRPATGAEKSLPPARWTDVDQGLRAYPVAPGDVPVVESTGLLYLLAAASLDEPGDAIEVLVFRRRDTQVVRAEVLAPREISVRYDELWPRGAVERRGRVRPLRLGLTALPVPGSDPEDTVEILGLRGRLELYLDPVTRAPLQLSGSVKLLGNVTLRAQAVRPR